MKKIRFLVIFLTLCEVCFSQVPTYNIQLNNIDIYLVEDRQENIDLFNKLAGDSSLQDCVSLVLHGTFLELPQNIDCLSHIRTAQISSFQPICLKNEFSKFEKLEDLMIFSEIAYLDETIMLSNIKSIWFKSTNLKSFPKGICNWISLEDLDIQDCNFFKIPKEIGNLINIESLNLSSNKISILPIEIFSLEKLKILGLGNNKLQTLSPKVCEMRVLKEIYLDNNKNLVLSNQVKEYLSAKIRTLY